MGNWGTPARPAKKFSVIEIGSGTWTSSLTNDGVISMTGGAENSNRLLMYDHIKSNIGGYGEGWWMYGIKYNGVVNLGSDTSGFIASFYMTLKPWNPSKQYYGGFMFSIGTSGSTLPTYKIIGDNVNEVYNKQLSDAFEYPIPILNPKFPLYEIVSGSGNFRVYCGCRHVDGSSVTPVFWDPSAPDWATYGMSPAVLFRVQHRDGTMEPAKVNLTTAEEDRWLVGDFEVEKGDKIILDITGYPGAGYSGGKSSFWFTKDVAGWDMQTY